MTRVVGGTLGGRVLRTPSGGGTRPTSDRVREAVFSSLVSRAAVDGARVLDLFAGTGALGLEALSRGAAHATFVESDRRAAGLVRANVAALGVGDRCRVVGSAVAAFLAGAGHPAYDLVLLDPPYPLGEGDLAGVLAALADRWLAPDAVVVVERSVRSPEPAWPSGLVGDGHRVYGETAVWYAVSPGVVATEEGSSR